MTPSGFVSWLIEDALAVQRKTGLSAKFMVSQAALETGWGSHITTDLGSGVSSNNLFNIKAGKSWLGPVAWCMTHEVINGQRLAVRAAFRAYDSPEQSFEDYARLLSTSPRYAQAWAVRGEIGAFALALQAAGYATDPCYAEKIIEIAQGLVHKGFMEA